MARECKAKRDERRFGKPERLIDRLLNEPWMTPAWWDRSTPLAESIVNRTCGYYAGLLSRSIPIDATNVCAYWQTEEKRRVGQGWDIKKDIPICRPPFDNLFIECYGGSGDHPSAGRRWGALVTTELVDDKERPGPPLPEGANSLSACSLFVETMAGKVFAPSNLIVLILDDSGAILDARGGLFTPGQPPGRKDYLLDFERFMNAHMTPIYLAISFLNCKNIVLETVSPDEVVNRERKKHGKRPFVRYHTINIEPMKRVLKTEGNIEANGLKKALHIVRGHFSTYTPERPLFGKVAGTFWVPAHTRGSLESGVVVSDYNVRAPEQPSTA